MIKYLGAYFPGSRLSAAPATYAKGQFRTLEMRPIPFLFQLLKTKCVWALAKEGGVRGGHCRGKWLEMTSGGAEAAASLQPGARTPLVRPADAASRHSVCAPRQMVAEEEVRARCAKPPTEKGS